MKKLILLLFLSLFFSNSLLSQDFDFMLRTNMSIGGDYHELDYHGNKLLYSPGGGSGLEVGIQYGLLDFLKVYGSLGYQTYWAMQYENYNGIVSQSSFKFNRKFFTLGTSLLIPISEDVVQNLIFGGGVNYNLPGTLRRVENEEDLTRINYNSSLGFHLEAGLRIKLSEKLFLDPNLRYRILQMEAKSTESGTLSDLPIYLQDLNANGVELGVTLISKIGQ